MEKLIPTLLLFCSLVITACGQDKSLLDIKIESVHWFEDGKASTVSLNLPITTILKDPGGNRFERASQALIHTQKARLWSLPKDYQPEGKYVTRRLNPETVVTEFQQVINGLPIRNGVIRFVFTTNTDEYQLPEHLSESGEVLKPRAANSVEQEALVLITGTLWHTKHFVSLQNKISIDELRDRYTKAAQIEGPFLDPIWRIPAWLVMNETERMLVDGISGVAYLKRPSESGDYREMNLRVRNYATPAVSGNPYAITSISDQPEWIQFQETSGDTNLCEFILGIPDADWGIDHVRHSDAPSVSMLAACGGTSTTPAGSQSLSGTDPDLTIDQEERQLSAYYWLKQIRDLVRQHGFVNVSGSGGGHVNLNAANDGTSSCLTLAGPAVACYNYVTNTITLRTGGGVRETLEPTTLSHEYAHHMNDQYDSAPWFCEEYRADEALADILSYATDLVLLEMPYFATSVNYNTTVHLSNDNPVDQLAARPCSTSNPYFSGQPFVQALVEFLYDLNCNTDRCRTDTVSGPFGITGQLNLDNSVTPIEDRSDPVIPAAAVGWNSRLESASTVIEMIAFCHAVSPADPGSISDIAICMRSFLAFRFVEDQSKRLALVALLNHHLVPD